MTARTISAAWVKGIVEIIQAEHLDARALFVEAGLDIDELKHPDARFAPEKISMLWELASQRSGNPALGLNIPPAATPASFDAVAYVMMSCPNLRAALERLLRYLRIVSDAADITLHDETDGFSINVELYGGGRPVPRQRVEFVLVTILNFCRWLSGRDLRPLAVYFANAEPADLRPYSLAFHCPLRFNAPSHRLLFSFEDVMHPLPTSNPMLAELHDRYAGEHLNRLENDRISFKARELIIRHLPDGDPLRADIAKALHMSERTLQRRLQEEGTSFNQLVDDIRHELARDHLGQHNVTLSQIAYLLGFADQSTFFRACKRWFGMSPGEYRSRIGHDPGRADG
ncbi:AraC family transcriptional regulator [Herbaspirillum sp. ST 5-3]|uniref:AraC family transcriptional regulator n=1 Tax=Oxalobacteraceae TaxID=75682 RepID=UPI0014560548|nr:AraC family transcriptional regulator [Herbaspirillum sp. ST 5-3]